MRTLLLISIFTTSLVTQTRAQQDVQIQIQQKFNEFAVSHLQEKLFVHTDKETYASGERLWFKAYAVDGTFHKPLSLSKVLYFELIDQSKKPILQEKIDLIKGNGNGSVQIPDLTTGEYLLRAYTRWMRNNEPAFFFQKKILIFGVSDGSQGAHNKQTPDVQPTIQFFPEGGDLVAGLESKLAFKVSGPDGKGIESNGVILNQSADTVARFQTLRFGMGTVNFKPRAGESYRALFDHANKLHSGKIPKIKQQGYVMRVSESEGVLNVEVSYYGPRTGIQDLFMLAHTRQFPYLIQKAVLKDNEGQFQFQLKDVLEGITHLTVFNDQKLPVCERLYFIQPKTKLTIGTSVSKNNFQPREEVSLAITSKVNTATVAANLSVSVFKLDSLESNGSQSISEYLMLTSDLKGEVESPEYYFSSADKNVLSATDNLMLTHGWRRFNWKSVFDSDTQAAKFSPESEGMVVSGQVKINGPLQTTAQQELLLSVHGASVNVFTAESTPTGRFEFYVRDVKGVKNMVVVNRNNTLLNYVLDNSFEDSVYTSDARSNFRPTNSWTLRERLTHSQVMNQVVTYSERPRDTFAVERPFYGKPSVSYTMADYVAFPKVEDVLREYVPEVIVRANERRLQMYLLDKDKNIFFTEPPLVLVDGVPIINSNKLTRGSANSLEKIEIIPKKYFLGPTEFSGIINFKTATRNLAGFELDSTSFVFSVDGPQVEREFYAPAYPDQKSKNSRLPDFRQLLYWNPDVKSGEGENVVRFYTGDKVGKFIGVVHGITNEGVMGSKTFTFEITEPPRQ
jgi:hypothetical protein